jgi:hypothetical protein
MLCVRLRYCTHLHMGERMEDAYIVDNSIHRSFQRAVTLHDTHYARVANNVAYLVRGHTYFVEVCWWCGVSPGMCVQRGRGSPLQAR